MKSNEILHCLGGRQRCYEVWGATEDGVGEGYGVSCPQCRGADYLELFSMETYAAACSNNAPRGSFPCTRGQ